VATHKVPQDVEAEDKLLGPLSLKQFIFTILGLGFGYLTIVFATKVHIVAAIIWIPPMIVCFVLGLYQRKDQPVEVYLASALRFYLKPHKRTWSQDGYEERVIVTAPPKIERNYTKNFTSEEATSRLSSLSRMMDSRGWASKLTGDWQNPQLATAAASDRLVQPNDLRPNGIDPQAYMQPVDVMDEQSSLVAQDFQAKISLNNDSAKQHALQVLQQARQDTPTSTPQQSPPPSDEPSLSQPTYQQYPAMHQKVLQPQPVNDAAQQPPPPSPLPQTAPAPPIADPLPAAAAPQPADNASATTNDDGSVEIRLH
jgi:hypothetical protein